MKRILISIAAGFVLLNTSQAVCADYYSVSVDASSGTFIESAWQEAQAPTAWAPQPLEQVVTRGVALILPKEELVPQLAWEVDLGILQPDGNILHLLGTAVVSDVALQEKTRFALVTADLEGVQVSDCRARLAATVDVDRRLIVVEKLAFNCLGRDIFVAAALHPKE